jgi:hypothetical protein
MALKHIQRTEDIKQALAIVHTLPSLPTFIVLDGLDSMLLQASAEDIREVLHVGAAIADTVEFFRTELQRPLGLLITGEHDDGPMRLLARFASLRMVLVDEPDGSCLLLQHTQTKSVELGRDRERAIARLAYTQTAGWHATLQ